MGRCCSAYSRCRTDFNPPTPWGVGRIATIHMSSVAHFNPPTPWGVGRTIKNAPSSQTDFNPPTPWGVGRGFVPFGIGGQRISIHPPRGGWDTRDLTSIVPYNISIHPPRGGWDKFQEPVRLCQVISIHPPRGGWDLAASVWGDPALDFNPPTPWGVGRALGKVRRHGR